MSNISPVPVKGCFIWKRTKMRRWQLDVGECTKGRSIWVGPIRSFERRQGKGLGNNRRIRPGLLKWLLSFLLLWRLAPVRARGGRWGNIIWLMGGGGSPTHAGALLVQHFWLNSLQPLVTFASHPSVYHAKGLFKITSTKYWVCAQFNFLSN